jgi:hypothetical protein
MMSKNLDIEKVKQELSLRLRGLGVVGFRSLENVIRTALFDNNSQIDWEKVGQKMSEENPEIDFTLKDNNV